MLTRMWCSVLSQNRWKNKYLSRKLYHTQERERDLSKNSHVDCCCCSVYDVNCCCCVYDVYCCFCSVYDGGNVISDIERRVQSAKQTFNTSLSEISLQRAKQDALQLDIKQMIGRVSSTLAVLKVNQTVLFLTRVQFLAEVE